MHAGMTWRGTVAFSINLTNRMTSLFWRGGGTTKKVIEIKPMNLSKAAPFDTPTIVLLALRMLSFLLVEKHPVRCDYIRKLAESAFC